MAAQPSTPAAKPAASPYYIDLTKDENWGEVNDVDGGIVAEFFQNIDNIIQATNMGKEKREEVFKQGKFFVKRFRSEIIPKVQSAKRTKTAKADKTAKDDDDTDSDKSDTDEKPKKNKKKVDDDPDYDPAVGDLPTEDEMEEDDDAAEEKRQAQIEAAKYAPVQQIIAAVKSLPATLSVPMKVGDSNLMDIAAAKSQKAVAIQTSATDKALQHHNFKSATNFISNRAVFNKMEKINKWLYNRARKYSDMYKSGVSQNSIRPSFEPLCIDINSSASHRHTCVP